MPNTKNAIGYPTEEGGFQEMGNTAPKVNMTADDISYDNSQSGASATNVQAAVDEAFSDLSEKSGFIKTGASHILVAKGDLYSGGTSTYTYTANIDCWVLLRLVYNNNQMMQFSINNDTIIYNNICVYLAGTSVQTQCVEAPISFPLKKGDVLKVDAPQDGQAGALVIYG